MRRQDSASVVQHIETIDGDVELTVDKARTLAKKMFFIGFAALPWLWFVNAWYFWPQLKLQQDPVVTLYVKRSAAGFVLFTLLLLPWTLTFLFGGKAVVGDNLWNQLSITKIDMSGLTAE
eukprot:CAMPEP_0197858070 /NCGR_PEP_ID=MMETSP1438-20131217/31607_1 /TAXON_ID=1461541 /ORGANISM="Pterosperma sp., Strain CCMP1384" /LENGTH=119 /DNA_ID=CAMNT_0043474117 /DNA_START=376 /DNA_END=735 /DNA_ORIENTATION=+